MAAHNRATYIRPQRLGRCALRVRRRCARAVIMGLGGLRRNLGLERHETAFQQSAIDNTATTPSGWYGQDWN
jgi:hypothetical protein